MVRKRGRPQIARLFGCHASQRVAPGVRSLLRATIVARAHHLPLCAGPLPAIACTPARDCEQISAWSCLTRLVPRVTIATPSRSLSRSGRPREPAARRCGTKARYRLAFIVSASSYHIKQIRLLSCGPCPSARRVELLVGGTRWVLSLLRLVPHQSHAGGDVILCLSATARSLGDSSWGPGGVMADAAGQAEVEFEDLGHGAPFLAHMAAGALAGEI